MRKSVSQPDTLPRKIVREIRWDGGMKLTEDHRIIEYVIDTIGKITAFGGKRHLDRQVGGCSLLRRVKGSSGSFQFWFLGATAKSRVACRVSRRFTITKIFLWLCVSV